MPKIVDRDAMRQKILAGCYELFALKGYETVTVQTIAKHLGISTGALYHYFPSKKAIFLALASYISSTEIPIAEAALAQSKTPTERLEAYINFLKSHEDLLIKDILLVASLYRHRDELNDEGVLKELGQRFHATIAQFISSDDPERIKFAFSFFTGLVLQRMVFGEDIDFDRQAQLLKLALRGLG
ncbi:MAG: TetR/AcrR family transcriptional regulator [Deinococcales bacterium]